MHDGAGRGAVWLAAGSILALFLALTLFNNQPIEDEVHHLAAIRWYCEGHREQPTFLSMLPGYHLFALLPAMLCDGPGRLVVLRAVNVALAIGLILVVNAVLRHLRVEQPGNALLHVAWNPLLFPFLPLVYTDGPALLCLAVAVYLHLRRRWVASGVALLLACLVRQSNLAWVAFMALWTMLDLRDERQGDATPTGGPDAREFLVATVKRVWPHCAVGLAIVLVLVHGGGFVRGATLTEPRFNPAQCYLFGAAVVLLWLPVWVECFVKEWRAVYWPSLTRAWVCAYVVAVPVSLFREYYNPHRWNRFLDDWKNWVLVGMTWSLMLRAVISLCIALVIPVIVRFVWSQPRRRILGLVWVGSLLFLLPHQVAEVRYYIVPVFLLNLFTAYTRAQARRLTVWYGLASAAIGASACIWGDEAGGLW